MHMINCKTQHKLLVFCCFLFCGALFSQTLADEHETFMKLECLPEFKTAEITGVPIDPLSRYRRDFASLEKKYNLYSNEGNCILGGKKIDFKIKTNNFRSASTINKACGAAMASQVQILEDDNLVKEIKFGGQCQDIFPYIVRYTPTLIVYCVASQSSQKECYQESIHSLKKHTK